jgi:Domain of unknown function (DUF4331)
MKKTTTLVTLAATMLAVAGGISVWSGRSDAADHLDPPQRTNPTSGGMDTNADIADLYTWHRNVNGTTNLVTVLSFAGPNNPVAGQRMPCDRNVIYTVNYDNTVNGDGVADVTISMRLAQDDQMNCFVQWTGVPGTSPGIVTPIEFTRTIGNVKLYAGLRDDAFFFDLQGFRDTLMFAGMSGVTPGRGGMAGIRMRDDVDFFAGKNTSAFVIEMPIVGVLNGATAVRVWATSARITM